MLRIILSSFISLLMMPLIAQENWERFDQNDGLISNTVIDFIEENPNKWWVATDFGISLYENGQIFNYPIIAQNPVLIQDMELAQGKIWMATNNGLYSFDGSSFEHFDTSNAFSTLDIPAIAVDSKDDLWIGTDQGVSVYDGSTFIRHDSINADYLYVDANDLVYAFEFSVLVNLPGFNYVYDNNQWVDYGNLINAPLAGSDFIQNRANGEVCLIGYSDPNAGGGLLQINYPNTPIFQKLRFQQGFGTSPTKIVKEDSLLFGVRGSNLFLTTDSLMKISQLRNFSTINKLVLSGTKLYLCTDRGLYFIRKTSVREIVQDSLENNQVISKLVENGPPFASIDSRTSAGFGFPKINPVYSIYTADFMFVGREVSTQSFNNTLIPYFTNWNSGPVNNTEGLSKSYMVKIKKQHVIDHIANYNQVGYQMPDAIRNWPALGDSSIGIASDLAPFIDVNQNGCYDPANGDYPYMKGDEAIYWIRSNPDENMLLEYHYMLYAYDNSQISELNQCQFLQCRIVNRGQQTYDSAKIGFFFDGDLGFPGDDYVGADSVHHIAYFYNGDAFDDSVFFSGGFGSNPPAVGIKYLSDSMTNAVYYNIGGGNNGDPNATTHWWNYMNSRWQDGTPLRYGGNGLNAPGTTNAPTTHMFTGDPLNNAGWTEANPGGGQNPNPPGDRRLMTSSPVFSMNPGDSKVIEIVVGYGRKASTSNYLENVPELIRVLNTAGDYWDSLATQNFTYGNNYSCPGAIGLTELEMEKDRIKIYPNPARDQLFIASETSLRNIQFYSMAGGLVREMQLNHNQANIDLSDFDHGLYLIRMFDEAGKWTSKKLIVE